MKLSAKQREALDALVPRQRAFVLEWFANGFNGKQAALAVGYAEGSAEVTASQLLREPKVAAAVEAIREPTENRKIASLEERRERWTAIARGELKDVAIIKDVGKTEVDANLATRMKADEMLGRSFGDFVDRKEMSGPQGAPVEVRITFTDKALRDAAAREDDDG